MKKIKLLLGGLGMMAVLASGAVSYAGSSDPGYCNKQGRSDCNGKSECAGPHRDRLPPGQANKCGK